MKKNFTDNIKLSAADATRELGLALDFIEQIKQAGLDGAARENVAELAAHAQEAFTAAQLICACMAEQCHAKQKELMK